jgi:hypothetical protein
MIPRNPGFRLAAIPAVLSLLGATLASCSDSGTNVRASFTGEVELLTEVGDVLPSADGVTVEIAGPGGVQTQITGEDGSFAFDDLDPGIYDLVFSKPGFGIQLANRIRLGNVEGQASLPEISSVEIVALELSPRLCNNVPCLDMVIKARNAFPVGVSRRIFRAFLGPVSRVSTTDYPESFFLIVPSDDPGITQVADTTLIALQGVSSLYMAQLPVEAEIRMLFHGSTENFGATYRDAVTVLTLYSALSTTFADETFINP